MFDEIKLFITVSMRCYGIRHPIVDFPPELSGRKKKISRISAKAKILFDAMDASIFFVNAKSIDRS